MCGVTNRTIHCGKESGFFLSVIANIDNNSTASMYGSKHTCIYMPV